MSAQVRTILSAIWGMLLAASITPIMAQLPPADSLTENSASFWIAGAEGASASVADDTTRVQVGNASLRFETDGGFDTWILTPPTRDADWDFSRSGGISFWVYAENPNTGFQEGSPWIRLYSSASDYLELRSTNDVLNEARGQWIWLRIPFTGDARWRRTVVGNPDMRHIRWIEIHADTWEAGFRYWLDGLRLDMPINPPAGQMALAGNHKVSLYWLATDNPHFQQYEIYRDTQPFHDVSTMTPIGIVSNINQTQYEDLTAENGVAYYYAVALRLSDGTLSSEVESIGPRTPYDETDLQVVSISRTPRYPRYDPLYTYYEITEPSGFGPYIFSAATGLGSGQDENTQRQPQVGDTVVYTATVRNRGTNPWSGLLVARWYEDDRFIHEQHLTTTLQPREVAHFNLPRIWDGVDHQIRFELAVNDARLTNNSLQVTAESVGFLTYIDLSYMEDFRERTRQYPQAATDDMIDWLNRHMARFNQMFAEAGTPKRVHYEVLETLFDFELDPDIDRIYFAIFPFRFRAGDGDIRLSGYYDPSEDIDFGLLHEMGHQLGLIDLYRLNVHPEQNLVNGLPFSAPECLMSGVSHFLSRHSALAMTHWYRTAHGYYGQYLYAIPETVKMRFLDRNGNPLAGARVRVFQKCERPGIGEVITDQIKAQGLTDANGEFTLPNVPIDPSIVPPAYNGDQLRDNPFGYVAVVGTNGVLLFEIETDGFVDYAWLDITEVNVAYWEGQTTTAVFERRLNLGGPTRTCTPADLTENNASSWIAWAQNGTIRLYNDTSRVRVGSASLRVEATGGFDNYVRYPGDHQAIWDLTGVQSLHFWCYAENRNEGGFQEFSPRIRLGGRNGYIELRPTYDILNEAIGQWREFVVPLAGNATWQRVEVGSVALDQIHYLQIHADTWGAGFTLWLDDVRFDPPLRCPGDVDGSGCVDDADLLRVLFAFGQNGADLPEDLNHDGWVDDADLLIVLFNFGTGC